MTDASRLLELVKRRFDVTATLSYLHARQLRHQQARGGLEIELTQIQESLAQHEPPATPPPSLVEIESRVADAETALHACREDIAAREAELDDIDRHIGDINTQTMEA